MNTKDFKVGDKVSGRVGHFKIIGFKDLPGATFGTLETHARVKAWDPEYDRVASGSLCLPLDILTPYVPGK